MPESGFPLFDLVPDPQNIVLDDQSTEQELIRTPDHATKIRVVKKETATGLHTFKITHELTEKNLQSRAS